MPTGQGACQSLQPQLFILPADWVARARLHRLGLVFGVSANGCGGMLAACLVINVWPGLSCCLGLVSICGESSGWHFCFSL